MRPGVEKRRLERLSRQVRVVGDEIVDRVTVPTTSFNRVDAEARPADDRNATLDLRVLLDIASSSLEVLIRSPSDSRDLRDHADHDRVGERDLSANDPLVWRRTHPLPDPPLEADGKRQLDALQDHHHGERVGIEQRLPSAPAPGLPPLPLPP